MAERHPLEGRRRLHALRARRARFHRVDDALEDHFIPWAEFLEELVRRGWSGFLSSEYEGDHGTGRAADQLCRQHAVIRTLLAKETA